MIEQNLSHYRITKKLGAGGMGEVYLAEDTTLNRRVALKLLPAEYTQNEERLRRFKQEARAASALNHPNILTIHEVGEAQGHHFIATEFIDGDTLRQHLKHTGKMKTSETLAIAAQVASALAAAHEAGIVHRDIKPDNVMIRRDGIVKVLDFGIAKLIQADTSAIDTEVATRPLVRTETGRVMGTVAYMSPEQVRGLDLDPRTDIWSLGVVLYEMAAGFAPFTGETSSHVGVSILEKEPAPLGQFVPTVPPELQRLVRKALAKERDNRYQTARDLLIDLKNLSRELDLQSEIERSNPPLKEQVASATGASASRSPALSTQSIGEASQAGISQTTPSGETLSHKIKQHKLAAMMASVLAAIIVGGIILSAFLIAYRRAATVPAPIDSVAVLPFFNASQDSNTEYLADGLTEDFINTLSRLSDLRVVARTTAFRFKGRDIDPQNVGRELGVGAVLTGKVTQQGEILSVQVDLIRIADGTQLWGEKYSRKLTEVLKLQEEIVQRITERLRPSLSGEDKRRIARKYTDNTEAYQAYLKGRYYATRFTEEDLRNAIEHFNRAIKVDPNYALAYVGLADAYYYSNDIHRAPHDAMPKAKAAALRALEIDNNLAEAHVSLAIVFTAYDWNWTEAEKEFRRAIDLNPEYPVSYELYGWHLSVVGRFDEAREVLRKGQQRDPLSLNISAFMGLSFYREGKYDSAIEQLKKTLEMDQNFWLARVYLGWAYAAKAQYAEAIAEFERAGTIDKNHYVYGSLGQAYALAGRKDEARKMIVQLTAMSKQHYVSPYSVAIIYAGLGENDAAFDWLHKAYEERSETMGWIKVDDRLDKLRSDPRFQDLMRRVGLSP